MAKGRRLKVYGWTGWRNGVQNCDHSSRTREVMASPSKIACARELGYTSLRSLGDINETFNAVEIARAMACPGVVFFHPIDQIPGHLEWHRGVGQCEAEPRVERKRPKPASKAELLAEAIEFTLARLAEAQDVEDHQLADDYSNAAHMLTEAWELARAEPVTEIRSVSVPTTFTHAEVRETMERATDPRTAAELRKLLEDARDGRGRRVEVRMPCIHDWKVDGLECECLNCGKRVSLDEVRRVGHLFGLAASSLEG